MTRLRNCLASIVLAAAAPVFAAPIALDTPAKAAAGVLAAHHIGLDTGFNFVSYNLSNLTILTRQIGTFALLHLDATTTPAATLAGTVVVSCPISGRMTAKLSPSKYLLTIKFIACKAPDLGFGSGINTYGGEMQLQLPAASFTPTVVYQLRAGSAASYLKHERLLTPAGTTIRVSRLYNVVLSGTAPITQGLSGYGILGSFSYSVTGFTDTLTQVYPDPLLPPAVEDRDRSLARTVYIAGNRAFTPDGSVFEDNLSLLGGLLTHRDGLTVTTDSALRPYVMNITHASEVATGIRRSTIDGGLEFYWHPAAGAGCLNGEYQFETSSDLTTGAATGDSYQAGDLRVNSAANASYFYAPLPNKMRINVDTPAVGNFDYWTPSNAADALGSSAGCLD